MPKLSHRELLLSLKYGTIEASFSVPMLHLTTGNLPFAIGFAVKALGWGPAAVGFLAATPFLAYAIQPPISHALQRRFSLLAVMRIGFIANAVPWFGVLLFPGIGAWRHVTLAAIAFVSSLANSVCAVAWSAAMAELVPLPIRGRYFGRRNMIFASWALAATLAAGQIADLSKYSVVVFGWIFAAGAASRLFGLFFLGRMKFPLSVRERRICEAAQPGLREILSDTAFLRLLVFNGLFGLFLQFGMPFINVFALEVLRFSLGELTVLVTIASLAGLLSLRTWGTLIDRYGNRPVMIGGSVFWLTGTAMLWLVSGPERRYLCPLAFFIQGFVWAIFQICQFNLMIKMTPSQNKLRYISIYFAFTNLLSAVGPLLGGAVLLWLPRDLGGFLGQPVTSLHLVVVTSLLFCLLSLGLLHGIKEPKAGSLRELLRVVRASAEFNPFLGLISLAQQLFAPAELGLLARHSVRMLRRQITVLSDVGEELADGGLRALDRPIRALKRGESRKT